MSRWEENITYGLDAAKPGGGPTGDVTNALYFATDTNKVYVWDGAAWQTAAAAGASDADAIHDNVSGEISAVAEKASPLVADLVLIEDSAAANAKKRVQIGNFPVMVGDSGAGGDAGYVPAPAAGDAAAGKFLKADGTWTALAGGGDALTANNLDQFVDVTQTAGKTLAITDNTTLAGGSHSGTNTGDQNDHGSMTGLADNDHPQYTNKTGWNLGYSSAVTMSWDDGTRTFTIAPTGANFEFWVQGTKYTKTGTPTQSVAITDTDGLWYIYYNSSGTLTASQTPWSIADDDKAFVATVYWDATANAAIQILYELHTWSMDAATHEYLHHTFGTRWESGLSVGKAGGSSTTELDITAGKIHDEDIEIDITDSAGSGFWQQDLTPASLPILYRSGASGLWKKLAASTTPVYVTGNVPQINKIVTGSWAWAGIGAPNNHFVYWVIASSDINEPVYLVPGQEDGATLAATRDGNSLSDMAFGNLPTPEAKVIGRVIMKYIAGAPYYEIIEVNDYRNVVDEPSGSAALIGDHGALTGLGDDDHTQYLLASGSRGLSGSWNAGAYTITASTFSGALSGNATTATTATNATNVTVASEAADTSCYPLFVTDSTPGNLPPKLNTNLSFNSSTAVLTASGFSGPLTGNVTGNCSGSSGSCTGNSATATLASTVTVADTTDSSCYVGLFEEASGSLGAKTDTGITYNASTGVLTATGFSGPLTGNVTGDVSGSSGSCTGNAATATLASTVTVADTVDTSCYVGLFEDATGSLAAKTDTGLTYNAGTGVLTATGFSGPLTGNVTGNCSGSSGSCTGNSATVTVADAANDTTTWPLLGTAATGSLAPATDADLTYNANTGALGTKTLVLAGATSGTTTLAASAEAGSTTATFPATTGTVALTANKLSAFAATTSTELAGVISDETGSGALVFGTSPTLDCGGSTSVEIPNGAGGTTLAVDGEVCVDTTRKSFNFYSGAEYSINPLLSKSVTIESPAQNDDITIAWIPNNYTLKSLRCVIIGTGTPSCKFMLRHSTTDRSATGTLAVTLGTTLGTNDQDNLEVTSFDNASGTAGWLWVEIPDAVTTTTQLHVTVFYTETP